MRGLKMSWKTEGGHLVCCWIELKEREKCELVSVADRLRLSYNPGNQSTRPFTWPSCQAVRGLGRVA
jgi:hypothetical protein